MSVSVLVRLPSDIVYHLLIFRDIRAKNLPVKTSIFKLNFAFQ